PIIISLAETKGISVEYTLGKKLLIKYQMLLLLINF
ncbi:unnamed protein product, partial [marine sediment metagenome]